MRLFEKGRQDFLTGSIAFLTDTIKAALLDLNTPDTGIKAISGATNATPITITAPAHGFSANDIVFIDGVLGNLAANGLWQITNVTTNTFDLQRLDGVNVSGSGSFTSGGYAVCLGPSAAGDFLDDFDAARVGTDQTLTNKTATNGVADADDVTFPTVTGASVEAVLIYKDTGTPGTSRPIALLTGKHIVTAAANAATSATSIPVEPLKASIPSGAVLTFSNGFSATLSAAANTGDRTISVSALANAIAAGHVALAPQTGSGLPVTPNGGNINFTIDNGNNRLFKL